MAVRGDNICLLVAIPSLLEGNTSPEAYRLSLPPAFPDIISLDRIITWCRSLRMVSKTELSTFFFFCFCFFNKRTFCLPIDCLLFHSTHYDDGNLILVSAGGCSPLTDLLLDVTYRVTHVRFASSQQHWWLKMNITQKKNRGEKRAL